MLQRASGVEYDLNNYFQALPKEDASHSLDKDDDYPSGENYRDGFI
jgi:hypothetical protein